MESVFFRVPKCFCPEFLHNPGEVELRAVVNIADDRLPGMALHTDASSSVAVPIKS